MTLTQAAQAEVSTGRLLSFQRRVQAAMLMAYASTCPGKRSAHGVTNLCRDLYDIFALIGNLERCCSPGQGRRGLGSRHSDSVDIFSGWIEWPCTSVVHLCLLFSPRQRKHDERCWEAMLTAAHVYTVEFQMKVATLARRWSMAFSSSSANSVSCSAQDFPARRSTWFSTPGASRRVLSVQLGCAFAGLRTVAGFCRGAGLLTRSWWNLCGGRPLFVIFTRAFLPSPCPVPPNALRLNTPLFSSSTSRCPPVRCHMARCLTNAWSPRPGPACVEPLKFSTHAGSDG